MTDINALRQAVLDGRRRYFLDALAPYVHEGILDARRLLAENSRLYHEFRVTYRGVERGCRELGLKLARTRRKRNDVMHTSLP